MIEHKGINYDVGTVTDVNWRPDYNPQTVERELEIIKNDLHCNAVGISGKDIGRVVVTLSMLCNKTRSWAIGFITFRNHMMM